MVWGLKTLRGRAWIPPPSYFKCLKFNWNKHWHYKSMSRILSKTIIKLIMSSLVRCNYVILCFGGQSPTFDHFSIFTGIKLKVGGGINSETLMQLWWQFSRLIFDFSTKTIYFSNLYFTHKKKILAANWIIIKHAQCSSQTDFRSKKSPIVSQILWSYRSQGLQIHACKHLYLILPDMTWSPYHGNEKISIKLSGEIFSIGVFTALKFSLKHYRKHILQSLRLYGG